METYASEAKFERDKAKMWADGWVVAEELTLAGKRYDYGGSGTVLDIVALPVVWLFKRAQPKDYLHVKYVRRGGSS